MRTSLAFSAALASLSAVSAAPANKGSISTQNGYIGLRGDHEHSNDTKEYIVTFNRTETIPRNLTDYIRDLDLTEDAIVYNLTSGSGTDGSGGVTGWVLRMGSKCAEVLSSFGEVAHVEEKTDVQSFATQSGAPWGLQRISSEAGASGDAQGQDFTYTFDDEKLGAGVDIYVIDTGVRVSHAVFQGRAQEGFSFTGSAADGDGHGTHVAGTAAGAKFGVAQGANVFAVKVLGDDGSGSSSDTIAGMDWVISNHNKRKSQSGFVGSIMSMSWGLQGRADTVDEVIMSAIDAGIHVSVAAGNDGADACLSTPSHNGGANSAVVTVGSVNIDNQVSTFSNIGTCVDIYAPGEQILSSWATGDAIINFLSGTSMACPHVSGAMAYLMAQDPESLGQNPAALKEKLLSTARKDAFTGNTGGSANLLLSNGVDGGAARLMKNWVVPDHSLEEKRTVTGSPASWAKELNNNLGKRWELHSRDSPLRF